MAAVLDGKAGSVEVICEPGVLVRWVLDMNSFDGAEPATAATSSRSRLSTTLEVEQAIEACVAEHAANVARVVHTFCGRDIHLRDGSRIECRWQLVVCDWRCLDCNINTDAIDEYYMLRNEVWAQVNPGIDGQLCIGCVEHRLGRTLTAADFTDAKINNSTTLRRSPRLIDRLKSSSHLRSKIEREKPGVHPE
jgi:hypothetical protein